MLKRVVYFTVRNEPKWKSEPYPILMIVITVLESMHSSRSYEHKSTQLRTMIDRSSGKVQLQPSELIVTLTEFKDGYAI